MGAAKPRPYHRRYIRPALPIEQVTERMAGLGSYILWCIHERRESRASIARRLGIHPYSLQTYIDVYESHLERDWPLANKEIKLLLLEVAHGIERPVQ